MKQNKVNIKELIKKGIIKTFVKENQPLTNSEKDLLDKFISWWLNGVDNEQGSSREMYHSQSNSW